MSTSCALTALAALDATGHAGLASACRPRHRRPCRRSLTGWVDPADLQELKRLLLRRVNETGRRHADRMAGPDGGDDTDAALVPATTVAKPPAFHDRRIYG
jgi:hypothetical protein